MPKCYIKDYPRPQFVRRNFTLLNGKWHFAFDSDDAGVKQGWMQGIPEQYIIQVPFSYEAPLSGIPPHDDCDTVWYMRHQQFDFRPDERVMLIFEGVDHEAAIWVNGIFVGGHSGGYSRFSVDITDALDKDRAGKIVVRAHDSKSTEFPRGKQRWKNENYDCWYMQTTGIWKTVWTETISDMHIKKLKTTANFDKNTVLFELDFSESLFPANARKLKTIVSFGDLVVYSGEDVISSLHFDKEVKISNNRFKWEVETWAPEHPNLYDVKFTLYTDQGEQDRVESYFGVRKITTESGRVCLNNHELYLRMVLDQGYWADSLLTPPDEESLVNDLKMMLEYGYNGVRKHQKIEDERFYYWADVLGLCVWLECPSTYKFSEKAIGSMTNEWMEMVQQNYNHPSIITWVPFNESWGVPKICADKAQQAFTKSIYHLTKSIDPYRPVISNDGWEHTISDIITIHDYSGNGEVLRQHLSMLSESMRNLRSFNGTHYVWAGEHSYSGQPIMLSEFGGIAFGNANGWGYGNIEASKDDFIFRFSGLIEAIKDCPNICGYCYTEWTDVQQEINGHLDMEHKEKISADEIRSILLS